MAASTSTLPAKHKKVSADKLEDIINGFVPPYEDPFDSFFSSGAAAVIIVLEETTVLQSTQDGGSGKQDTPAGGGKMDEVLICIRRRILRRRYRAEEYEQAKLLLEAEWSAASNGKPRREVEVVPELGHLFYGRSECERFCKEQNA